MDKDKRVDITIEPSVVHKKAKEIGDIIEGLTLPYVLSILGIVIIECVASAVNRGFHIETLMAQWLRGLAKRVIKLPDEMAEMAADKGVGLEEVKDYFGVGNTVN